MRRHVREPMTHGDPRSALIILLDEVGSAARGESPLPDQEQLREWLQLVNVVAGSDSEND